MTRERPILFSAPMVRALLDGNKTQTRRVVKPNLGPYWNPVVGLYNPIVIDNGGYEAPGQEIFGASDESQGRKVPCGQPGDRLRVRETFLAYGRWVTRYSEKKGRDEWHFIDMTRECDRVYQYAADAPAVPLAKARGGALPAWYTRPAIFMPRAASRILLEIVSVRVERLDDISEADARAEGVTIENHHMAGYCAGEYLPPSVRAFRDLWESINGAGSWEINSWCWVVEFKWVAL
jgi:hypothetical protein